MEAPAGRGADGLWKSIAYLLVCFLLTAGFIGSPAGAKLTGESAIRQELKSAQEELKRLRTEHDALSRLVTDKLSKIDGMQKDLEWLVKWLQAAGRK